MFKNFFRRETSSLSSLFRELTYKERQHTQVFDFRDIIEEKPNNQIVITCEHATNNFHNFEKFLSKSDKQFINTHWAYDPGAKDVALKLAEITNTLLIYPNFSRLILDPNRSLISSTLIREFVEGNVRFEMNHPDIQIRSKRLELFYYPYHEILYEVFDFIKPKYFISVHSFTKQYENNPPREYEIGLLYNTANPLITKLAAELEKHSITYRHNMPYTAALCNGFNIMESYDYPNMTEGVCIEIRNDKATDPEYQVKISDILKTVMNDICKI